MGTLRPVTMVLFPAGDERAGQQDGPAGHQQLSGPAAGAGRPPLAGAEHPGGRPGQAVRPPGPGRPGEPGEPGSREEQPGVGRPAGQVHPPLGQHRGEIRRELSCHDLCYTNISPGSDRHRRPPPHGLLAGQAGGVPAGGDQ